MCGRHNKAVAIPSQNKNVCTACEVTVWVYSGLQIKWCKGCKNFKTWASFGGKGYLATCLQCRDRQNKLYAERKADNANGKEANVAHHSAIAAKERYDSICEQLYNDRKHTLIVQPECLVDPGPVDAELEAEMARIEEAMERSKGRELSTSVGSSSGTASASVIVLPRSSQYHVEAIYGICDGDHDEPPSGSTGTAGSSPSSKSSAGTGSTSTAVTTVEWSADDDEDGDDEKEMVEAEKAKAKPLIDKIHQTAVAEADNAAAGSSPNSNSNGTSSTSTAVTMTMTREEMQELARRIARERVDAKKAKKWAKARRIAAERVEAEKAKAKAKAEEVEALEVEAQEVEAKAKAFVDGIYQAAVAKAADAVTGSSPSSNSSSNGTSSTSTAVTAVTTTTRSGIGRDDGGSTSMDAARTDQLELAWRIAAERVQAETEEAKAKAIVDGYVQAAICSGWTDIGLKKSY